MKLFVLEATELSSNLLTVIQHRFGFITVVGLLNYSDGWFRWCLKSIVSTFMRFEPFFQIFSELVVFAAHVQVFRIDNCILHVTSLTRPSRFSACNVEKLGVACVRGYSELLQTQLMQTA